MRARAEVGAVPATMRAAVMVGPRRVEAVRVRVPTPGPGEILVRLEGSGVCASNLFAFQGREWYQYPMPPGAPGHEGWGKVAALGTEVKEFQIGQRVAILSGRAYAEYDVSPASAAVLLPPELDGRPFPGEPLGCAMNIFRRSQIQAGELVAVVGVGFLGALLIKLASSSGARVVALARRPFALRLAREMGATETIPITEGRGASAQAREVIGREGCDCVIEAVGEQSTLDLATDLTRGRGRLVIAGYHQDGLRQVNMQLWNWRGLDVINAHERELRVYRDGMAAAVEAVLSGRLDLPPLLTHSFPIERLGAAFEAMLARLPGFLKALVLS